MPSDVRPDPGRYHQVQDTWVGASRHQNHKCTAAEGQMDASDSQNDARSAAEADANPCNWLSLPLGRVSRNCQHRKKHAFHHRRRERENDFVGGASRDEQDYHRF